MGDAKVQRFVGARAAERAGQTARGGGGWGRQAARRRVLLAHGGRRARAHRARAPPTWNNTTKQMLAFIYILLCLLFSTRTKPFNRPVPDLRCPHNNVMMRQSAYNN